MEFRQLSPADQPQLEAFLLSHLESSLFLLGNVRQAGIVDGEEPMQGRYFACFDQGGMVAVMAHYWNDNLLIQAPAHLAELLAFVQANSQRAIAGVIGPSAQVLSVHQQLGLAEAAFQLNSEELLYRMPLAQLQLPELLEKKYIQARLAIPKDRLTLIEWRIDYCVEALNAEVSPELYDACEKMIDLAIDRQTLWVLEANDKLVAMSAFNAELDEAVQVGGVWTPEEKRGKGYARAVVAASLKQRAEGGVDQAVLFTDEANLAAQKVYLSLGFERIGDYRLSFLKQPVTKVQA